ncbi:unnamed protein product [Caenorhabditis nigoni]
MDLLTGKMSKNQWKPRLIFFRKSPHLLAPYDNETEVKAPNVIVSGIPEASKSVESEFKADKDHLEFQFFIVGFHRESRRRGFVREIGEDGAQGATRKGMVKTLKEQKELGEPTRKRSKQAERRRLLRGRSWKNTQ